ncbi:MAG: hypothetical protein KGL95_11045, partial [Patescibacteria group bacterium]|nr:hypothetical protein [Patescibacteria group bacterium]
GLFKTVIMEVHRLVEKEIIVHIRIAAGMIAPVVLVLIIGVNIPYSVEHLMQVIPHVILQVAMKYILATQSLN